MINKSVIGAITRLCFMMALLVASGTLFAQESETPTTQKKVVIVKKTIDEDGNETIEEKIYEGEEAEAYLKEQEMEEMIEGDFDVNEWVEQQELNEEELIEIEKMVENLNLEDLNFDIENLNEGRIRIRMNKNGEEIEWDGHGEIPEELLLDLHKLDGDIVIPEFEHEFDHAIVMIEDEEDRAVLGVMIENAGGNGAMITDVFDGSGADKAGLQKGDIIYKVDRKKVTDIESLITALEDKEVGEKVKVRYLRDGDKESERVTLGKMPAKQAMHRPRHPHKRKFECHDQSMNWTPSDHHKKVKKIVVIKSNDGDVEVITEDTPVAPLEVDVYELNVFPNPASEAVNIEFKAAPVPTTVKLISLDGKEVFSKEIEDFDGSFMQRIDLKDQEGGLILQIQQNGQIYSETIMK